MDSAGLYVLLRINVDAADAKWTFAILDTSPVVRRLLEQANLTDHFNLADAR
jgi:anti-anti-sigma regulatory factor